MGNGECYVHFALLLLLPMTHSPGAPAGKVARSLLRAARLSHRHEAFSRLRDLGHMRGST